MAGFIHIGGGQYLAMPFITSKDDKSQLGILDSIVNDLGGTNGDLPNSGALPGPLTGQWQVWDDLRLFGSTRKTITGTVTVNGTSYAAKKILYHTVSGGHPPGSYPQSANPYSWAFVTGSKISGATNVNNAMDFFGWDCPINCVLSQKSDGTAQIVKVTSAPTSTGWPGTVSTDVTPTQVSGLEYGGYYRVCRAIILKCNSAVKPFYVFLQEGGNAATPIMVQVFETWDNTTHTGTNGSSLEWLRVYTAVGSTAESYQYSTASSCRDIEATKVQYVLSVKNDFFALWVGADPNNGTYGTNGYSGDLAVAGNFAPLRSYDTVPTFFVNSNTFASGRYSSWGQRNDYMVTYPTALGLAQVLRTLGGVNWASGYMPVPKSLPYIFDSGRAAVDIDSSFMACDMELIQGSAPSGTAVGAPELKRGDIPYLKTPINPPSAGSHLNVMTFVNPDASTDQYVLLYLPPLPPANGGMASYCDGRDIELNWTPGQSCKGGNNQGGFYYGNKGESASSRGDGMTFKPKWFLVPVS